jgi:hypothetical protein
MGRLNVLAYKLSKWIGKGYQDHFPSLESKLNLQPERWGGGLRGGKLPSTYTPSYAFKSQHE